MKKCLLLIAILIVSQTNSLYSQTLFNAPDTVCVNQPVKLTSNVFNQSSYYWGFCSGYLFNAPSGSNMGDNFGFSIPSNIDIVNDSGTYYGFVINSLTSEFLRLNFGNSLNNVPTVTNFGNLTLGLPKNPTSLFIVKDPIAQHWFVFVSGGYTAATSELARIDFGPHMNNPAPNIANFHNPGNLLDFPKGIFVAKDANDQWVGYIVNYNTGDLIMLDFSFNVSNTPIAANMGNLGVMSHPSDLAAIKDNGNWYLFVTDFGTDDLIRVDLGANLNSATPTGNSLGNFLFRILKPSALSITRDCNEFHIYLTDSTTSQLVEVSMPTAIGPYTAVDYSVVGGMNFPSSISSIIRDKDNLYAFITNGADSSLTKIAFTSCGSSTIPSFTDVAPPVYEYTTPGIYNVYYVVDDGKPSMQVDCKAITVLPPPTLYLHPDFTLCQGDTAKVYAISTLADSIIWTSTYNIDTVNTYADSVRVFPFANTTYNIILYYPFGCIVDTVIHVSVVKVTADAGPDRYIKDGAATTLGGPFTSIDNEAPIPPPYPGKYLYNWTPYQFMSDSTVPNTVVSPPYDMTYYLTVTQITETSQCSAKDTVVIRLNCGEINAPNAFSPTSTNPGSNRFGLLNKEIIKLNYFRIYNRFGQLVFQTTDLTQKWDGLFNGVLAEEGVYVWEADAFCNNGKELKKSGNVTLLR